MKKWYQSRTILLQIITAAVVALRMFGVEVADGNDQQIVDGMMVIAAIVGNIALRFRTDTAIGNE